MAEQNQIPMHHNKRVIIGLILGAVTISFSGVWVKLSHVTPTASAFYRVFIGGLFLLLAALWRREIQPLTWRQTGLAMLCGTFFGLDLVAYHHSVAYVGPGLATILPNFQVFFMALAGVLYFQEKLGATYLWSIPLAIGGLFLVVGLQWGTLGGQYKTGVYFGLAAAIFYAGFMLSLRKLQADMPKASFFFILMVVSLITAACVAAEMVRTDDTFTIPDLQSLGALIALGLFSQCVGWMVIANALPHIRLSLSGLILLLQPALAFVWDVLFFHRPTTITNWMGVALALGAIYMGTLGGQRRKIAVPKGHA